MVLYWLRLYVIVEQIWWEYPGFLQLWYSDDFSTAGTDAHLKPAIACMRTWGLHMDYLLEKRNNSL